MPATILTLDSSIGISSVAIWRKGAVEAILEDHEPSMQSARLIPLIEATLAQAGIGYGDLTLIACTTGPGSFTGIRIGLAAARGIAYAANIPSVGFTTLEVMAHAAGGKNVLAILNAGKGEVFYQYFSDAPSEPAIGKLNDVLTRFPKAIIASSIALPEAYAKPAITFPQASALAELAALGKGASELSPFYIRPPDAKPQTALFTCG